MCIKKRRITKISNNIRILTVEEESKIVSLLRNTEHSTRRDYFSDVADLIEVLVDTGMRKLEAEELMFRDVDFEKNLILVRATKGAHRRIPMTKRVATILKRRQEAGQHKPFDLNDLQLKRAWTWVREQMGLKDDKGFVLHALRSTYAFRLVNAEVDLNLIKKWLGYSP